MWLMLTLPEAEPLVSEWRREHDPYAASGVPAHTTVRKPFVATDRWNDPILLNVLRSLVPVELTLARIENRPGALVVVIEPDDALREITQAVSVALPELSAHKASRADLAYHVTVVRTVDPAVRSKAKRELEQHLPVVAIGRELWAGAQTRDGFTHRILACA